MQLKITFVQFNIIFPLNFRLKTTAVRRESRGESLFYERMKASLRETEARLGELRQLASEAVATTLQPEDDDVLPAPPEYSPHKYSKPATATLPATDTATAAATTSHPTTSAATGKLWPFIQDDEGSDEVGDENDVLFALPSAQYSDANFGQRSRYLSF